MEESRRDQSFAADQVSDFTFLNIPRVFFSRMEFVFSVGIPMRSIAGQSLHSLIQQPSVGCMKENIDK